MLPDTNLHVFFVCCPTAQVNLDWDIFKVSKIWNNWWDRDNFHEDEDTDNLKQGVHFDLLLEVGLNRVMTTTALVELWCDRFPVCTQERVKLQIKRDVWTLDSVVISHTLFGWISTCKNEKGNHNPPWGDMGLFPVPTHIVYSARMTDKWSFCLKIGLELYFNQGWDSHHVLRVHSHMLFGWLHVKWLACE